MYRGPNPHSRIKLVRAHLLIRLRSDGLPHTQNRRCLRTHVMMIPTKMILALITILAMTMGVKVDNSRTPTQRRISIILCRTLIVRLLHLYFDQACQPLRYKSIGHIDSPVSLIRYYLIHRSYKHIFFHLSHNYIPSRLPSIR